MSNQSLQEGLRKMGSLDDRWAKLTFQERIHLCRESAQEAERLAETAHPDLQAEYKRLAADWRQIAAELEKFNAAKSVIPKASAP